MRNWATLAMRPSRSMSVRAPRCQTALERLTEPTDELQSHLASRAAEQGNDAAGNSGLSGRLSGHLKEFPPSSVSQAALSGAASQRPSLQEPPTVAGYEILGELGRGGMGVVYKARHVALDRLVALKMILAGTHAGPKDLARFRQEAAAIARLHHPNIVQVFDIGDAGGRPYFALEYVEQGSLAQHLRGEPQPLPAILPLMETLARDHGVRPSMRHHPSRSQTRQYPAQYEGRRRDGKESLSLVRAGFDRTSRRSPISAWRSGWMRRADGRTPMRCWARPVTWLPSRPTSRRGKSVPPPMYTLWERFSTRC